MVDDGSLSGGINEVRQVLHRGTTFSVSGHRDRVAWLGRKTRGDAVRRVGDVNTHGICTTKDVGMRPLRENASMQRRVPDIDR